MKIRPDYYQCLPASSMARRAEKEDPLKMLAGDVLPKTAGMFGQCGGTGKLQLFHALHMTVN